MGSKGWIKAYRQLQECWIWEQKPFSMGQAWIDLLLLANHSDKTILFNGSLITVKRGQYLTSLRKLSEKWGWHRNTVTKFLRLLENDGMILKESDNSRTLLTVIKYDIYQGCEDTEGTPNVPRIVPPDVPHSDHGMYQGFSTNKNDKECIKNEKNKKKNTFCPPTVDEVKEYLQSVGSKVDAEAFVAFYESKGWMIGKNKMKSWKMAVVTWEKRNGLKRETPKDKSSVSETDEKAMDLWGDD